MDTDNTLERWKKAGLAATIAILLSVPLYLGMQATRKPPRTGPSKPLYVGSGACRDCHQKEYAAWKGSNHALAMLAPGPGTVLGDFNNTEFTDRGKTWRFYKKQTKYFVHTDDVAGPPADFEIAYTFGWFPLQQYIVVFPGGRLQCISVAWDVPEKRWFTLHPEQLIATNDWLHWTRPASNWNTMCSQCHSTGVRKRYNPANRHVSHHLVRNFRGLRGLSRARVAPCGVGPDTRNGPTVRFQRSADGENCDRCPSGIWSIFAPRAIRGAPN